MADGARCPGEAVFGGRFSVEVQRGQAALTRPAQPALCFEVPGSFQVAGFQDLRWKQFHFRHETTYRFSVGAGFCTPPAPFPEAYSDPRSRPAAAQSAAERPILIDFSSSYATLPLGSVAGPDRKWPRRCGNTPGPGQYLTRRTDSAQDYLLTRRTQGPDGHGARSDGRSSRGDFQL